MALIQSVSGIRGTIGGHRGENLTPFEVVHFCSQYAIWLLSGSRSNTVVIGRDARISGPVFSSLVAATLQSMGVHVIDLGLSTTPTVQMAVVSEKAGGGIIITASHNPRQWNALKLLNEYGEFLTASQLAEMNRTTDDNHQVQFATVDKMGAYSLKTGYIEHHIREILALPEVKADLVAQKKFKIVVDCCNSTAAISALPLLEAMGCKVIPLFDEMTGNFDRNPEPLPESLQALSKKVTAENADAGLAFDPDVDRLAIICEDGEPFGEEYTLVAVADYMLRFHGGGVTVSNLSSTNALRDVTLKHGGTYYASKVGEAHVVETMKLRKAIIGGEGNGGVIHPGLHYGRDALAGAALFLTALAQFGKPVSFLRRTFPQYVISKNKIQLPQGTDLGELFDQLARKYAKHPISRQDGLKLEFDNDWVHLRSSNTEPIIRIYAESSSEVIANNLANKLKQDINELLRGEAAD